MKSMTIIFMSLFFCILSWAQQQNDFRNGKPPRGPQLTDTQKSCIDNSIKTLISNGDIEEGQRVSREIMGEIMSACGVERPSMPPRGDFKNRGEFKDSRPTESSGTY